MYNADEYNNDTTERDAREAREMREAEADARMEACDAGRVSYRAAIEGGALYASELMESVTRGWVAAVSISYQEAA